MIEGQTPTTLDIAKAIATAALADGADIHMVQVRFVTDGLYAVEVQEMGVVTPERFFHFADKGRTDPA